MKSESLSQRRCQPKFWWHPPPHTSVTTVTSFIWFPWLLVSVTNVSYQCFAGDQELSVHLTSLNHSLCHLYLLKATTCLISLEMSDDLLDAREMWAIWTKFSEVLGRNLSEILFIADFTFVSVIVVWSVHVTYEVVDCNLRKSVAKCWGGNFIVPVEWTSCFLPMSASCLISVYTYVLHHTANA